MGRGPRDPIFGTRLAWSDPSPRRPPWRPSSRRWTRSSRRRGGVGRVECGDFPTTRLFGTIHVAPAASLRPPLIFFALHASQTTHIDPTLNFVPAQPGASSKHVAAARRACSCACDGETARVEGRGAGGRGGADGRGRGGGGQISRDGGGAEGGGGYCGASAVGGGGACSFCCFCTCRFCRVWRARGGDFAEVFGVEAQEGRRRRVRNRAAGVRYVILLCAAALVHSSVFKPNHPNALELRAAHA